jgi:hypothetical protein
MLDQFIEMSNNPWIQFLKQHKGSGLTRDQLVARYRNGNFNQFGGADQMSQLTEWWYYVNGRIGMTDEDDTVRDRFLTDLLIAADGRPITQTIFTIAHAMWHGDGIIRPGIWGTKQEQLDAINEGSGSDYREPSITAFISSYLDQSLPGEY